MKTPRYRITYPDNQAAKLANIRTAITESGVLDDGSLRGWAVLQRVGASYKGERGDAPFAEIQIFESPESTTLNRARVSTVSVTIFWYGEDVAINHRLAIEKTPIIEGIITANHPTLTAWTSLVPAEVDEAEGLFVAYVGTGTVTQRPHIETL